MSSEPKETVLHKGNRFNVHLMQLEGRDGNTYEREVIRHPGAVVLVPMLDPDTVVLIENTRPTVNQTLLELPAGTMEWDEPPESTAVRELAEETGYRAESFTLLHEFYSAPGISDELMYLYVAEGLSSGQHAREAVENIENRVATREEIVRWIEQGRIRDGKTLIGLYAFLHSPKFQNNI